METETVGARVGSIHLAASATANSLCWEHPTEANPRDAGRFINHSSAPNVGFEGSLRDIAEGEEILMDYSQHGDPESWTLYDRRIWLDPLQENIFCYYWCSRDNPQEPLGHTCAF